MTQSVHKVTLIPGDGIGPEVTQAAVRVLEATGVKFNWETFAAGLGRASGSLVLSRSFSSTMNSCTSLKSK